MKSIRYFFAFLQSLLPFIGFLIIAVFIYDFVYKSSESIFLSILASVMPVVFGFFISRSAFIMMKKKGVIELLSSPTSSPELDNLENLEKEAVLTLDALDLANQFNKKKLPFSSGKIRIWGDWEGRQLKINHQIKTIEYNTDKNILTILFTSQCLLKVKNPQIIFVCDKYLKIPQATEILWQVKDETDTPFQFSYLKKNKEILTKSNTNWTPHELDIGVGENALYLQG